MAQLQVDSFSISQAQLSLLATNATDVTIEISYDSTPNAGFKIMAFGPLNPSGMAICARPCSKVSVTS